MANNVVSNTSDIVLQTFLDEFMSATVLMNTIDSSIIQGKLNPKTGETIQVKRPHQYKTRRTTGGDISSGTNNDIISGTAVATVQDFFTAEIEYSILEEAIDLNQLSEIIRPAAGQLAVDWEVELSGLINNNAALQTGTAGTPVTEWSHVAAPGTLLQSIGVPVDRWWAVMNPASVQNLAKAQGELSNGKDSLVNTAWEDAQISTNFGGIRAVTSNALQSHTNGAFGAGPFTVLSAPTQTYESVKDSYIQTIIIDGLTATTGTLVPGDVIQIETIPFINLKTRTIFEDAAGAVVNFTAVVVTGGTANGSGEVTVTITAPIFEAGAAGQYNNINVAIAGGETVNIVSGSTGATNTPNLFYHRQAFGIGSVKLPKLAAQDSSTITEKGISIRMTRGSEILANKQIVRFDFLPTFAVFNPLFAGRFYGGTGP